MSSYSITFACSACKELDDLDVTVINRVFPKIEALANNPRPPGCRKLRGEKNLWRIRIGDYRIIYSIDDTNQLVDIIVVRHRSKAYR